MIEHPFQCGQCGQFIGRVSNELTCHLLTVDHAIQQHGPELEPDTLAMLHRRRAMYRLIIPDWRHRLKAAHAADN